jgi:cytochrome o ubiquinol oxidase subunit 3
MTETVNNLEAATSPQSKTVFGFWIYLMTDCVLFATLFATYGVLHNNTNGGPPSSELFSLPFVLLETIILLTSSYTSGLALLAMRHRNMRLVLALLGVTFALGLAFLMLEISEFRHLAAEGNSWQRSGFLSAFFTLVGTHGLHIASGLLWLGVLMRQLMKTGFTVSTAKRLTLFSLFWHFLDIIWIFIFTIVYLMGAA